MTNRELLERVKDHLDYIFRRYDTRRAVDEGYGYITGIIHACPDLYPDVQHMWANDYIFREGENEAEKEWKQMVEDGK